jgi:hypothetical protein
MVGFEALMTRWKSEQFPTFEEGESGRGVGVNDNKINKKLSMIHWQMGASELHLHDWLAADQQVWARNGCVLRGRMRALDGGICSYNTPSKEVWTDIESRDGASEGIGVLPSCVSLGRGMS